MKWGGWVKMMEGKADYWRKRLDVQDVSAAFAALLQQK